MLVLGERRKRSGTMESGTMQGDKNPVVEDAAWLAAVESGRARPNTMAAMAQRNPAGRSPGKASRAGLFSICGNRDCDSGWLHLWRSRSAPIFEDQWSCSAGCTVTQIEVGVRRELAGKRIDPTPHRHRVPLGLVMLEQGWINSEQLRRALEAQRETGQGKLGQWLILQQNIPEYLVTRALGLQWNSPVLSLDRHDPQAMASILPRLFLDAFAVLPLRIAAGQILYLGFEDRLDPVVALAAERMTGLRVEAGLVRESSFQLAHRRMLEAAFPATELIEASSASSLARALGKAVERVKPMQSKLIRMHDCLWLRMWRRPPAEAIPEISAVEDVIASLAAH
jgi:hypothetical protein